MSFIPSHTFHHKPLKYPKLKYNGFDTENLMYNTYKCSKTVTDTVKQHLRELG